MEIISRESLSRPQVGRESLNEVKEGGEYMYKKKEGHPSGAPSSIFQRFLVINQFQLFLISRILCYYTFLEVDNTLVDWPVIILGFIKCCIDKESSECKILGNIGIQC